MKKLFVLILIVAVMGCTSQDQEESQGTIESEQNSVSSPADAVKNIKNNVQGTLDQIKARDQQQQDLAN